MGLDGEEKAKRRFRIGLAGTNPADFDPPPKPNVYAGARSTEVPPESELLGESFENEEGARLTGSQSFSVAQRQGQQRNPAAQPHRIIGISADELAEMEAIIKESRGGGDTQWWYPWRARNAMHDVGRAASPRIILDPDPEPRPPTDADLEAIWNGEAPASTTNEERARGFLGREATYDRVGELARLLDDAEARGAMDTLDLVRPAVYADAEEARGIINRLGHEERDARRAAAVGEVRSVAVAYETMRAALAADADYRHSWVSDIAMVLHDRHGITGQAERNAAAEDIMDWVFPGTARRTT